MVVPMQDIPRKHFRPTVFKILATRDRLTAAAGLGTILEIFDGLPISRQLAECLPERSSNRSLGSYRLALMQMASFIHGHDCLDDLDEFREDPYLQELMQGETAAARTMGDFLRDFEEEHIDRLRDFLGILSLDLRKRMKQTLPPEYAPGHLRIDIDSTSHEQCGKKMEGLAYNYKNEWCLDSQVCFDEMGLCHDVVLRPGNTKSGVGAPEQLARVFQGMKNDRKFLSADSAYCNQDLIRLCIAEKIQYTLTANDATTGWRGLIEQITEWTAWKWSEEDLQKAEKSGKTLPKVELGKVLWAPGWAPNIRIQIVIKRTPVDHALPLLAGTGTYDYYGVVTNFNLLTHSLQDVIEFHNKRGNAERFIREEKYGYDFKHFPCQKLRANHAFLLLGMIAHNILRWIAYTDQPSKPNFAKKLRRRFVFIPGKVVRHARQLILRIPERFRKEVMQLREAMGVTLNPSLDTC